MTNVLVCVKRVPDSSGEVLLAADAQSVDARFVGFTISPHESCAVELAVKIAEAGGGTATVLTLGPDDAVEQLRSALGVGCTAAVLIEADLVGYGPADAGDFQVGIRLAYELGRPVVNGIKTAAVEGGEAVLHGDAPDGGVETFRVPLPAVATVLEGGVEPRYPSMSGRIKAKKVKVETVEPVRAPGGPHRVKLTLPPAQPSTVEVLGEGPETAPALVDLLQSLGVTR
jgi:electron transfer flavoprotein beta subunit